MGQQYSTGHISTDEVSFMSSWDRTTSGTESRSVAVGEYRKVTSVTVTVSFDTAIAGDYVTFGTAAGDMYLKFWLIGTGVISETFTYPADKPFIWGGDTSAKRALSLIIGSRCRASINVVWHT